MTPLSHLLPPLPGLTALARTAASALQRLKALGILNWVRRCAESWQDGRFVLEQQTNAYAVLPESQWRGYRSPQDQPAPLPGTWGDPPPLPSALAQAGLSGWQGAGAGQRSKGWPGSRPGAAGAGVHGAERLIFSECTRCGETCPRVRSYPQQPADGRKEDALNKRRRGESCRRVRERGDGARRQRAALGAAARHGEGAVREAALGRSGSGGSREILSEVRRTHGHHGGRRSYSGVHVGIRRCSARTCDL
jgi:hypothetical protein